MHETQSLVTFINLPEGLQWSDYCNLAVVPLFRPGIGWSKWSSAVNTLAVGRRQSSPAVLPLSPVRRNEKPKTVREGVTVPAQRQKKHRALCNLPHAHKLACICANIIAEFETCQIACTFGGQADGVRDLMPPYPCLPVCRRRFAETLVDSTGRGSKRQAICGPNSS